MKIETRPIIRRVEIPMMYCPNDTTTIDVVVGTKMVKCNRALSHRERYIMKESSRDRIQTEGIINRSDIHRQKESVRLNAVRELIDSLGKLTAQRSE